MAYRDSTSAAGFSNTAATAVPTGVQAGDIVVIALSYDSADEDLTSRWPSGFTELFDSNLTTDTQSVGLAWKRLTGSDSGSYTCGTFSATDDWAMVAVAFSGRHGTNPPVATEVVHDSGDTSPVSVAASGVTAVAGDDLLWVSGPDITTVSSAAGHTAPTDFIEREDADNGAWAQLGAASRDNVSGGATGTITGTLTLTSGTAAWVAYLVRIPALVSTYTLSAGQGSFGV
jgi:hypothetical protein